MKKLLISLCIVSSLFAQEQIEENSNIVKTSELELFLFKIGFQSLLNDVEITKNKSSLNEEELKKLNQKVNIIMDEVYKSKRVLKTDSSSVVVNNDVNRKEIESLKNEIALLKEQMNKLQASNPQIKEIKKEVEPKVEVKKIDSTKIATVRPDELYVRAKAAADAQILQTLKKGDKLEIQKCSKFGWCKLKGEKKYVAKFLLDF